MIYRRFRIVISLTPVHISSLTCTITIPPCKRSIPMHFCYLRKADPEAKMSVSSSIKQVADCDLSYAIPVDALSGMLVAHVEWANRQAEQEGNDPPPVIQYECRDFDYETFGTVEKIFNRSYIDELEIEKAKSNLTWN